MDSVIAGYDVAEHLEEFFASSLSLGVNRSDGAVALIKSLTAPYPRNEDIARLKREFQVLDKLRGTAGVIDVSGLEIGSSGLPAILMKPFGRPLSHLMRQHGGKPWPVDKTIEIAISLVRALEAVHARDVVHKNLSPQNILLDEKTSEVRLLNFEIASELTRERQGIKVSKRLEGSVPYISPEQTGRMNRDLDYRSDYYSLGVVLYELLTGRLPFEASGTLEWIHAHISKVPPPPRHGEDELPVPLAGIVLKLLSKSPDDRYQSSYGLLADLQECRRQLKASGAIVYFPLAAHDLSEQFRIPQVLFGREAEVAKLLELFEQVAHGSTEICLISGYSGVGKSSLVAEMNKPLVRTRGYIVQGKFDQFGRNTPYAAISSALAGLVDQLIAEPAERLENWREAIVAALGANARVLIDIVPDLEKITGPQPPVPELPPAETQNRLQIVFLNFIKMMARPDRPLVIFLDDLQWADGPTLSLLQRLATSRDTGHLFIIGAYRSNEVESGHLLLLTLEEIAKVRPPHELAIEPLGPEAVGQLVADALKTTPEEAASLSGLIFRKTEGNPFFVIELLKSLEEERLIRFDRARGKWTWDIEEVAQAAISESIVDFMLESLKKLPDETRNALQLAACIGSLFDLRTLSVIYERPMAAVLDVLMSALRRNVIVPLDDTYRYVNDAQEDGANPVFRFQHDRIQQAAYALIGEEHRQAVHLSIGRLIEKDAGEEKLDECLIDIVRHLDEGRALVTERSDQITLARYNLEAARRAHNASAYHAALQYLEVGRELLGPDAWADHYELAKALSAEFAQCAYLTGRYEDAEAEIEASLAAVGSSLEKAEILAMRTRQYSTMGRMEGSIRAAIEGLHLLGIAISIDLDDETLSREVSAVRENLAGRPIASLIDAPKMSDPEVKIAIGLLMEIFPAAFLSGAGNLFQYLVVKSVNLSLRHGNSPETAFAYATYGMLLCGALNDPRTGYEYGRLALAMNERFDDIALKSRIIYVYAMFIHHWSNHWTTMTEWFRKGIEAGTQSGDMLYLAYSAQDCIIWDPTLDLETASQEQRKYLQIVRDCEYEDSFDSGSLFLQMQLNFLGRTESRFSLNADGFDEAACYERMRKRGFMTGVANYHIYKTEIHTFYGDWQGALGHIEIQDRQLASVMSLPQLVRYRFAAFLALAQLLPGMPGDSANATLERLRADHRQMKHWAENCPDNFRHIERAMAGELARVSGDIAAALKLYSQAIASAHEYGFQRDEAVIGELAGKTLLSLGLKEAARAHIAGARYLFYRWGAYRKVEVMDEQYAELDLANFTNSDISGPDPQNNAGSGVAQETLDLASVMKAARAISGEIVLENLWTRVMHILLENAGAERGVLLTRRGGRLHIEVEGRADREVSGGADKATAGFPESIVSYALRARRPVVLDDAARSKRFAADPFVAEHRTKSVICVPVVRSEKFEGAIYLENNLIEGAFTRDRVEIVELLAAQASISIENAELYVDLERKVEERTEELSQKTVALEKLSNQLAKYLSPQVYRSIFDRKQEVKLASERKRLTVFFSDIVGFTDMADRLESEELTQVLNQYLTEMSEIALAYGATIDKFVGDAIIVFFGDPETRGTREDALACVKMAIAMRKRLTELRTGWKSKGIENPLDCRIGIHTGYCTVGNFGSESRMDYTIIGGTVNLASRLEHTAQPGEILISYETWANVKDEIACEERGHISVRGIAHPVGTFQVIDLYECLETPADTIVTDSPNFRLNVDLKKMSAEERMRAAELLRDAVRRLETSASADEQADDPGPATRDLPQED
ncbi:AAA family ATPase [Stappia sp. GBMRC 2046]|uniref:AAA family ATPase n=1 Tax=Stappia sediminis TaxID=2692190 RepID=A0A7X3LVC1_9HYPH|nr:AAA family ATPase [Stappia sediminis]